MSEEQVIETVRGIVKARPLPKNFYSHHIEPVALRSRSYAESLGADPLTCEIAGLLHAIGMDPKKYNYDQIPTASAQMAVEILKPFLPEQKVISVAGCILAQHNLRQGAPLESVIFQATDAELFFREPELALCMMAGYQMPKKQAADELILQAESALSLVTHDFFRKRVLGSFYYFKKTMLNAQR